MIWLVTYLTRVLSWISIMFEPLLFRMMFIWHKENLRLVPEVTNDGDNNYRFLYLLAWTYSATTEKILEGIEQYVSKLPNAIFSGCTEITLGEIRTAAGAEIHGSPYHYCTMNDTLRER